MFTVKNDSSQSFLRVLSSSDEGETDEHLVNHIKMSTDILSSIVRAYDRILHKHDQVVIAFKSSMDGRSETLDAEYIGSDRKQKDDRVDVDSCVRTILDEMIDQIERKHESSSDDRLAECISKDVEEDNAHLQNIISSLQIKCHEFAKLVSNSVQEAVQVNASAYALLLVFRSIELRSR